MAPQLLWLAQVPWSGSPKGDACSFAILMRELIHHQDLGPFDDQNLMPAGNAGRDSLAGLVIQSSLFSLLCSQFFILKILHL